MISDEAVEAAARAMAPAVWGPSVWTFTAHGETPADARDRVQQQALMDARRILEAAAPHLWQHDAEQCKSEAAGDWHDAVSEAYVEGALSANAANVMWGKNPYR